MAEAFIPVTLKGTGVGCCVGCAGGGVGGGVGCVGGGVGGGVGAVVDPCVDTEVAVTGTVGVLATVEGELLACV